MKTVIFDFDGTLCDSLEAFLRALNLQADRYGFKPVRQDQLAALRDQSSLEILNNLGLSVIKLPFVVRKVRSELNREVAKLKAFDGLVEALKTLKSSGHRLALISSNSKENVTTFLKASGFPDFDYLQCEGSVFGKAALIKKLLGKLRIQPKDAIYIGDETRDIEAAKKVGVKVVAVTWGYNSPRVLEAANPDGIVENPDALLSCLQKTSEMRA